jgi:hypothetical protein
LDSTKAAGKSFILTFFTGNAVAVVEEEAVADLRGEYEITFNGLPVRTGVSRKSDTVAKLAEGARVRVVEISDPEEDRIFGRILSPAGWICLTHLGDQFTYADLVEAKPPSPAPQETLRQKPGEYLINFDGVPVRSGISRQSTQVDKLAKGKRVWVAQIADQLEEDRIFGRIESPAGWIALKHVTSQYDYAVFVQAERASPPASPPRTATLPPPTPPPKEICMYKTCEYVIVYKSGVPVRTGISRRSDVVGKLPQGSVVQVLQIADTVQAGRVFGRIGNPAGWICISHLESQSVFATPA